MLSLQRAQMFWLPVQSGIRGWLFSFFSIVAFAASILLLRRRFAAGLGLLLPLLLLPLPHYLVHVNLRHKYPIDWISIIGLGVFAHYLWTRRSAEAATSTIRQVLPA